MGSVKDLILLKEATKENFGKGQFKFSDRYSVFDWGEMPDHIPNKGKAIVILAAYFFEKLELAGYPTHYLGLVEDGKVKKLSDLKQPTDRMEIKLLRVIKPKLTGNTYDYSEYIGQRGNYLIPLEVIYRNKLPAGSSVFRRLKRGDITPQDLGLKEMPVPNQILDPPIYDVSTKLEITDRYISWEEAQKISGQNSDEIQKMKKLTAEINNIISMEFKKIGLGNEDGKIELGFDSDRNLMLVDVLGTLDECRFIFEDIAVSKEIARIHYRDTEWAEAVKEAKEKNRQQWKKICRLQPSPLPEKLKNLISNVYCAVTNEITGEEWFKNIPPLKEIMYDIKGIL